MAERIRKVAENNVEVTPEVAGVDAAGKTVRYLDASQTKSYGQQSIDDERAALEAEIERLENYDPAPEIADRRADVARLKRIQAVMDEPVAVDE